MINLSNEIWKPVRNFEGIYDVSNLGRIKSLLRCKILNPRLNRDGYAYVNLTKDNNRKSLLVHRLVAKSFLSEIEGKNIVNHINEIRHDNRVENLEWCTQSENLRAFWNKRNGEKSKLKTIPAAQKKVNQPLHGKLSKTFNPDHIDDILTKIPNNVRTLSYKRRNPNKTKEAINLMISNGYKIINGTIVNSNNIPVKINDKGFIFKKFSGKDYFVLAKFFVWYWFYKEIPYDINFKDGNKLNLSLSNLQKSQIKLYRQDIDSGIYRIDLSLGGTSYSFGSFINESEAKKASVYLLNKLQ